MQGIDLLFLLCGVAALLGVGLSLWVRSRTAGVCGAVLGRDCRGLRARLLVLAVLAAAAVIHLVEAGTPDAIQLAALGACAALTAVRPSFSDRVCGDSGVRRGWVLRRFEDLEEWRLIGEHLRFRLFGEWTAVPLDPAHHAAVRERLVAVAAERESAFGHGKDRP